MVVYADRDHVRRLAGGRDEDSGITDAVIDNIIERSDGIVNLWTQHTDWQVTDEEFQTIKTISELIASSLIRMSFKDESDEADEQMEEARKLLMMVVEKSGKAGKPQVVIKHRPYRTYPANPQGEYYSSTLGRHIKISDISGAE